MEPVNFLLKDVYLENFSTWLKQLISENEYRVVSEIHESITRYKVFRDGETVLAEIEAMQFKSNELKVRIAHIKYEIVDRKVIAFTDILLSALKKDYGVSHKSISPAFLSWVLAGSEVGKELENWGLPPLYSDASNEKYHNESEQSTFRQGNQAEDVAGKETSDQAEQKRVDPDIQSRRDKIRKAWESNTLIFKIANTQSCSESTVKRDLKTMGLTKRRKHK